LNKVTHEHKRQELTDKRLLHRKQMAVHSQIPPKPIIEDFVDDNRIRLKAGEFKINAITEKILR
jgi:hypothetical protein